MAGLRSLTALGASVGVLVFLCSGAATAVQLQLHQDEQERMARDFRSRKGNVSSAFTEHREQLDALRAEREAALVAFEAQQAAAEREAEAARKRRERQGLKVCNYSTYDTVDVAYVSYDPDKGAWMGRGWYSVDNGECRKILSYIHGEDIYLYASHGSTYWGGDHRFCTTNKAFHTMEPGRSTCSNGRWSTFDKKTVYDGGFQWSLR